MKTLIENADYFIYYGLDFPPHIFAAVTPNDDGTFSIFLNPHRSYFQRKKDLDHELNHIRRGDFYNGLPMQQIEDYL